MKDLNIVILLILAGVSINLVLGENGLIKRAQEVSLKTDETQEKEGIEMAIASSKMEDVNTLGISKTSLEKALREQFGNNKDFTVTDNGDGSFLIDMNDTQRSYYVENTGEIIDESNMIEIGTAEELKAFRDDVNSGNTYEGKYIKLTNNITLNIEEEWEPIGLYPNNTTGPDDKINNRYFKGIFDGNNYEINNIYINNSNKGQALFGLTENAMIKNIILGTNNNISGGPVTTGIVAYCYSSKIYNCKNKSAITGNGNYVGGIVGYAYKNSIIENCSNTGNITIGVGCYAAGGIVGQQQSNIQVINCINYGNITGYNHVGGIIGSAIDSSVSNCANIGNVVATNNIAAGIIGISSHNINIESCYNIGNIKSISGASGILAYQQSSPNTIISNCYTAGNIEANYNSVAICIAQTGIALNISNCYYLENTINGTNDVQINKGLTVKNSEELKLLFTELGENFKEDTNNIINGYPILKWQ